MSNLFCDCSLKLGQKIQILINWIIHSLMLQRNTIFDGVYMTSHFPRKRFAQHFLQDSHVIQRIIAAIAPQPTQHLVEIGPGKGALTLPLLQHGCPLDVIEIDRNLIERLEKNCNLFKHLRIHQADVLKFDFNINSQDILDKLC